ncbi:bifunctional diaminohydroxyphosphoribosylaminopyrimidine deaminase/5-amino-6-(5-phosphoribosylamino)uracil reductase RibD [Methylophaga sp. OBS4]|uniref:bifunctional diaminohydroxyphosphoribosylaminopyrimidine deaminase/5-amino-6-(5-phosphoribosylamino)uracil reductase RibD n=1 Tax=Methylophaga sp. OBS4 TaxID=2991935 RepID=UPI00224F6BBD|nr:bifunctional diaminohydroxyphosphoribosylaminopyrimidine deaminase/5-amino-6-(5-phosphoribosylamino)uracil reductase RibD [Methylophaga sp. OBS4]MCX4187860.1 bifunctional diaminohydroxyphosphoribosylaminopyrimidine deaminase/5-amino-6-(5-phosphoribosylamino)uracil reductase RibD [Methylophaga sp. OBS4]
MPTHEHFMARALQLAERGLYTADPNPRVGCVLVKNGEIIGEGWHQRAGEGHAEVNALHDAGVQAQEADCYVTLEPCSHFGRTPPCVDALIKAQVKRVFVAMTDPNPVVSGTGIERLRNAGIEVNVGIMAAQAEKLNPGFCQRMQVGRPFVRSKLAMSLDGRTAMASGESKWITGPQARADVQKLRARSSAIMTGIGTVLADNPLLNVRPEQGEMEWYPRGQKVRQPLRVIVDSQMRMPADARILQEEKVLLVTAVDRHAPHGAESIVLPTHGDIIDLTALMSVLAQREINELMVEAGAVLNGALLKARLIDELVIYMAPKIMGDMARGVFHLPGMDAMSQNISLHVTDMRAIGRDWRITAVPEYNEDF